MQLHQQKGMISLSPPTICNSAVLRSVRQGSGLTVPCSSAMRASRRRIRTWSYSERP
nr:hypothetical protein [Klebsiella michiganensis]UGK55284.1 Hypothetical protein [Raoultella ornithinolytica]